MTTHDQSGPRPGDLLPATDVSDHSADVSDHSADVSDHSADVSDDSRRSHLGARAKSSVVIVGGGLSGLAAAEALARARPAGDPTTITVLEAKRATGGRAGSFETAGQQSVDYCQHVAMGCCTELLGWMRRMDLLEHWVCFDQLTYLHRDWPPSRFRPRGILPAPLHLAPTLPAMKYFSPLQKWRLAKSLWRLLRTPTAALSDLTVQQWLDRQSIDPEIASRFWEIVLVSALGDTLDRVSMSAARKVIVEGFCASAEASTVWVPALPLSDLFGIRLTQAVRDLGVEIKVGTRVRSIAPASASGESVASDGSVANGGFELRLAQGDASAGDLCHASDVVMAAPWHRWNSLLRQDLADRLGDVAAWSAVRGSPITGLHLWTRGPISERPHAVLLDSLSQWYFRNPHRGGGPNYSQVVISGSHGIRSAGKTSRGGASESWQQTVLGELSEYFDVDVVGRLENMRVVTDPNSVYSLSPEVDRMRPATLSGVDGFYWASDFAQTSWPSTMEGAVRAGRQAASQICRRRAWPEPETPAKVNFGMLGGWLIRS